MNTPWFHTSRGQTQLGFVFLVGVFIVGTVVTFGVAGGVTDDPIVNEIDTKGEAALTAQTLVQEELAANPSRYPHGTHLSHTRTQAFINGTPPVVAITPRTEVTANITFIAVGPRAAPPALNGSRQVSVGPAPPSANAASTYRVRTTLNDRPVQVRVQTWITQD
jgi:hypothetical protein